MGQRAPTLPSLPAARRWPWPGVDPTPDRSEAPVTIDRNLDIADLRGSSAVETDDVSSADDSSELEASRADAARLREELVRLRSNHVLEVETLSAQLDLTSAELCVNASRYDRALEALEAQHVRDLAESDRQHDEQREAFAQEIVALRTRIEDLESSTSWRVTAGLRKVTHLLNRLRKLLRVS